MPAQPSTRPSRPDSTRYPTLQPEIRHIAPETVNTKWINLSPAAQRQVRDLIRAAARPVLVRYRDDDRRVEAQAAVDELRDEIERKLPRFPFPPDTRDGHFDYEALLDGNVRPPVH